MTHRRPTTAPRPVLSDQAHAAITLELGRLILNGPGPDRPELAERIDPRGVRRPSKTELDRLTTSTGAQR